jgi:uncharacterized protein
MTAVSDKLTATDSVSALERAFTPGQIELRSGGSGRILFGYGAIFGQLSRRMQFGFEQVSRSFFDQSAADGWPDVVCRAEHDPRMLLGATHSGTLRLAVDHRGLAYECDLARSRQDVLESCTRGDYPGSSFAFLCTSDEFEYRNGTPVRTLLSGRLIDTGPVTVPAYGTSAPALRSLARHMQADYAEVAEMARKGELRQLFGRTDIDGGAPTKTLSGADAMALMEARRWPPGALLDHNYRALTLNLHARRIRSGW